MIIPGAGHLFEERGKLEETARIAAHWFEIYLLENGKKFQSLHKSTGETIAQRNIPLQCEIQRSGCRWRDAAILYKYKKKDDVIVIGIPRGEVVIAASIRL